MKYANTDEEIIACFAALSVLRPHLKADQFVAQVRRQQEAGYTLAYIETDTKVTCAAGFRIAEFLAWGKILYIDDLITLPEARGRGYAGTLLDEIIAYAREQDCDAVHLDSGYQRSDAHRLYLNHGFTLSCHHFALSLLPKP